MRRRTFFGMVGAGAAVAAMPGAAFAETTPSQRAPSPSARGSDARSSDAGNIDFLLAPLVGRSLAGGFRVASISAIERGAVTITLSRASDAARSVVQVFRRSAQSTGLATTRLLDLRWMNGGDGEHATPEAGGVAVMTLASRIRRIEAALVRAGVTATQRAALARLHTHEHRNAIHGAFDAHEAGERA